MFIFPVILVILNDLEEYFILSCVKGLDVDIFKMFMLLYTDDIVILPTQ